MRHLARGHTLVETLAVISIFGVTLALLAGSLHAILRITSRFRDEEARAAMILQLDLQFRTDVHDTSRVMTPEPNSTGDTLRFVLNRDATDQIEYQIKEGSIHRLLTRSGVLVQREAYSLDKHTHSTFEVVNEQSGTAAVTLRIERAPDEGASHNRSSQVNVIRATLGEPVVLAKSTERISEPVHTGE